MSRGQSAALWAIVDLLGGLTDIRACMYYFNSIRRSNHYTPE
jgi:hypothetical protein